MEVSEIINQHLKVKPFKGVDFYDINPVLQDKVTFNLLIKRLAENMSKETELVAGIEARGFVLASAMAFQEEVGMIMVRKEGKLPPPVEQVQFNTEYSNDLLEVASDVDTGKKVWIVDDILATGGTAKATFDLMTRMDYDVLGISFLIEIDVLKGRELLPDFLEIDVCHRV